MNLAFFEGYSQRLRVKFTDFDHKLALPKFRYRGLSLNEQTSLGKFIEGTFLEKKYICPFFFLFTSMFVERMEVLEYRQKFEVELSTFPDSTNTKTPRKLVFSLTCVCLCVCLSVCLSVCAKKFVSGYLTRELTDLDENYGECCNWRRIENLP